jgi:lysophospholipase L1-like esterase
MLRVARDVIGLPGVTDCVVQVGTNDLGSGQPERIIDELATIYRELGAAGIRPWGGTIVPKGEGVLSRAGEATRQQVNAFIRGTRLVHGVVDFDAELADPVDGARPRLDTLTSDGIHPSSLGHQLMATALVKALRKAPEPTHLRAWPRAVP